VSEKRRDGWRLNKKTKPEFGFLLQVFDLLFLLQVSDPKSGGIQIDGFHPNLGGPAYYYYHNQIDRSQIHHGNDTNQILFDPGLEWKAPSLPTKENTQEN
jgi:hypothetical protein